MPQVKEISSQINIKLEGQDIPQQHMDCVLELSVDQHAYLPDMFFIRLYDQEMELLDGPFDLAKKVEIEGFTEEGKASILIKGEITALEPVFDAEMITYLVVRGYDDSHRLCREIKSRAFLNVKDSDLAEQIAQGAGLEPDVESTSTVYDHIYQHNQSDLAFLRQRAWRIGYECYVENGKLHFSRPQPDRSSVKLTWGEDLISFRPQMSLAEQVSEVLVKGWDVEKQRPIIGRADQGGLYPQTGEEKDGITWAKSLGQGSEGRLIIVGQPINSQAEADALAAARMNELSGTFIEAEGVAFRRPDIRAGQAVKLDNLGERFSGTYLVTSATHSFSKKGLDTTFHVRGTRTGTVAESVLSVPPLDRWPGLVTAVVTNTDDPKEWGRVKVKFPWMSDDAESSWARLLGVGAGPQAGLFVIPEVGDEVIVAFEYGDFDRPMVLGGMWNGQHQLPPPGSEAPEGKKPLARTWCSRSGHAITMYDDTGDKKATKKVKVITAGGHKITLDDTAKTITVESTGDLIVRTKKNMKLEAKGSINIVATKDVSISGKTINLN